LAGDAAATVMTYWASCPDGIRGEVSVVDVSLESVAEA
jgi:hypothetical protein